MNAATQENTRKIPAIRLERHDEIAEYFQSVNGRAYAHVAGLDEVLRAAERAEDRLAAFGLPKEMRVGAELTVTTEGPAKSYKYATAGSFFRLVRYREGWRLAEAEKVVVYAGQRESFKLAVSEEVAEEIRRRATSHVTIKKAA